LRAGLEPAINATGVFLHTGLGRAPLAPEAVAALAAAAGGFAPVEIDVETGQRGRRAALVEPLLARLTGAEAATVVNNNAAALTIAIRAVASGFRPTFRPLAPAPSASPSSPGRAMPRSVAEREGAGGAGSRLARSVVVSRGELIEIGGAFRLPEIIEAAGARLREVGTTNRTRLADYERAIDDSACALLKAHPSNYRIEGFTQEATIGELAGLGRARGLPVIHDIGSGVLNREMVAWLARGGIEVQSDASVGAGSSPGRAMPRGSAFDEPVASESIAARADLVLFSGDKLLGGPQCGVIVGGRELVSRIERHPLMRALRVDKLTLSALEATLRLHEAGSESLPLRAMLARAGRLRARAEAMARQLAAGGVRAEVVTTEAQFGAGSAPGATIGSVGVAIEAPVGEQELAARLRRGGPRVLGRIEGGRVVLDLAAVLEGQDGDLARAVLAAAGAREA